MVAIKKVRVKAGKFWSGLVTPGAGSGKIRFSFFFVVLADVYDRQTFSAGTNLTSLRFSSSGSHVSYQTHLHLGSNWNRRCSRNLVIKDFVIDLFIGMLKLSLQSQCFYR